MVFRAFFKAHLTTSPPCENYSDRRLQVMSSTSNAFRYLVPAEDSRRLHHRRLTVCDNGRDQFAVAVLINHPFHEFVKIFSGCCLSVFGAVE